MSRIKDPSEETGGGPGGGGFVDPSEGNRASGESAEHGEDKERGGRGEGGKGGDAPKTASKGINPVQHSE